jgi:tetratricopeptide (TPR) repeat protein
MRRGLTSQALEYLEMASAIDPENPLYPRELVEVYATLGAHEESEKARLRADRLEGAFQSYAEAIALVSEGKEEQAAAILESVVRGNPEFITGAVLLADLYRKTGLTERALELYQKVLERDPSRARAREETAWLHVDRGELETALEILEESGPGNANSALLEGYQKLVEADWEGAVIEFRKAEMQYPLNPKILQQISLCLSSMGRPREALAYLGKAHRVEPEDTAIDHTARLVRFDYGLELEKQGKWKDALAVFEALRKEEPETAVYLFHVAYCFQNLWDYERAIDFYMTGLRLDGRASWVRINLATCLYALSRYDDAAEQWEILVASSHSPEYVYHLGLARIRQWRLNEGWKLIEQAAEAGFEPAQNLLKSRHKESAR